MKLDKIYIPILIAASVFTFFACEDETTTIGSGIAAGEVQISMDTFYFDLGIKPVLMEEFDARTGNHMIGSINVPEYGKLDCSFVTRLMCAADLQVPDSLLLPERVDSCKIIMAAQRDDITGDSLAPQKLAVYRLEKQLPSSIRNNFDPEGYYNPDAPLGELNYTVSNVSASDSMFYNGTYIQLEVNLPKEFGQQVFEKYKSQPEIFEWPQTFASEFLPGLLVKPTFGNGCIANIDEMIVAIYYHSKAIQTTINDGDTIKKQVNVGASVLPFATAPEVLSSNNINYVPSENIINLNNSSQDGQCIITTPGGYIADFTFPIDAILDRYTEKNIHLSTVNDLQLHIPAENLESESGIPMAENLLLIKASEYDEFFEKNKIPDNVVAFTGAYDSKSGQYVFSSMRQYFIDMLKKNDLTTEDTLFRIVPVEITTETTNNGYYGTTSTYITKCVPYIIKPTMTLLKTDNAMVTFSFSTQLID